MLEALGPTPLEEQEERITYKLGDVVQDDKTDLMNPKRSIEKKWIIVDDVGGRWAKEVGERNELFQKILVGDGRKILVGERN